MTSTVWAPPATHYIQPDSSHASGNAAPLPNPDASWGLYHADVGAYPLVHWLDQQEASTTGVVRRMTAAQYATVHAQFDRADVPGSVVFPWLYGINDQSSSLAALANVLHPGPGRVPPPHYRGMATMRADMPSAKDVLLRTSPSSSAADSSSPVPSSSLGSDPVSPRHHVEEEEEEYKAASPTFRGSSSDLSTRDSVGTQSSTTSYVDPRRERGSIGSMTSIDSTESCSNPDDETESLTDHALHPARPTTPAFPPPRPRPEIVTCIPHGSARPHVPEYDPQPTHSRLMGTFDVRKCLYAPMQASHRSPSQSNAQFSTEWKEDDAVICASAMDLDPMDHSGSFSATFMPTLRPLKPGVSPELRNFAGQYTLYTKVSDIVLYCPTGLHSGMLELATWIAQAQEAEYRERVSTWGKAMRYNVFVVEDSFEVFEQLYPSLVQVGSQGVVHHSVDFEEDERILLQVLYGASEVGPNVFVGGPGDNPHTDEDNHTYNPCGYAVVIQADPSYTISDKNTLSRLSRTMDQVESTAFKALQEDYATIDREAGWVSGGTSTKRGSPSADDVRATCEQYVRQVGPLSRVRCAAPASRSRAVDALIDLALWMYHVAEPCSHPSTPPIPPSSSSSSNAIDHHQPLQRTRLGPHPTSQWSKKVLLYSNDGYMSIMPLLLTYIMVRYALSLPQAILFAHKDAGRELFILPDQVPLLRSIEARVHARTCLHTERRPSLVVPIPTTGTVVGAVGATVGTVPRSPLASSSFPPTTLGYGVGARAEEEVDCVHNRSASFTRFPTYEGQEFDGTWINHPSYHGSLASRVRPQLYLGSADHAINIGMVRAQGITHILSVGEPLLQQALDEVDDPHSRDAHTLWGAYHLGLVQCREVPHVRDDGLDSLRGVLPHVVRYIHGCIQGGGSVLVHCQAGVSRSATVIMAYLMAHEQMTLEDAYSYVRARRLGVLIQPTLLFFWELRSWALYLAKHEQGDGGEGTINPVDQPQGPVLRSSWLGLAELVARANVRYGYRA